MTRATVTAFEYEKSEKRYYLNFKAGGDAFYIVKDYVKSFGRSYAEFVKRHAFRDGTIGACWKITASVLVKLEPVFTNLEETYEEATGESWGAFLRKQGISASRRAAHDQDCQDAWEVFQEDWMPDESYRQSKARQSNRRHSSRHTYETPKQEETFKQEFNDASKSAFDAWFQAEMDAIRRRQEQQARENAERQRQREEAARQNVRESETFVRVKLPQTSTEALSILDLPTANMFAITKEQLKAAFNRQIKQYHPDLHRNDPEEVKRQCEIKIRQVNAAYDLLSRYAA